MADKDPTLKLTVYVKDKNDNVFKHHVFRNANGYSTEPFKEGFNDYRPNTQTFDPFEVYRPQPANGYKGTTIAKDVFDKLMDSSKKTKPNQRFLEERMLRAITSARDANDIDRLPALLKESNLPSRRSTPLEEIEEPMQKLPRSVPEQDAPADALDALEAALRNNPNIGAALLALAPGEQTTGGFQIPRKPIIPGLKTPYLG